MTQKKKVPLVGGGNKFSPGSEKLLDQLSAHNSIVPDCHPWRNDIYYSREKLTTHQSTGRVYGDLPSRGTAIFEFPSRFPVTTIPIRVHFAKIPLTSAQFAHCQHKTPGRKSTRSTRFPAIIHLFRLE